VRLAATFFLVVLMVTIPLTIWLYQYAHGLIEERTQAVVASLLEHDHGLVASSVATHDYWQLFRLARSLAGPDYIASAAVLDEYGNLLAHSDPAAYGVYAPYNPPPDASAEYIPIMGLRGMVGELVLVWNHAAMTASFAPVRSAIIVVTGVFALLACLLGVAVALLWRSRLLRILGRAGAHQGMVFHFAGSGGSPAGGQGDLLVHGDELDVLEHELIQAFDQLRLSEWVLNSVQEYVLLIDSQGYIRHVNRKVEALRECGRCRDQHISELCAGSDYPELARQLEERDSGTLETSLVICKYRFPALISFRRSDDMTVVTITDLTEYQRLKERVAKLRALSTLGEMSSELSHEIKNDIAPVKLLCQAADLSDDDRRVMLRSINRIDQLVNDFMDFVRGEEQEVTVLSLRKALKDCYGKFANMAEAEGITLSISATDTPVEVSPGGFRMVVANLVRNAIQAAPPGGRVWVEARVTPDGTIELVVSDNGPGVAPHIRERLFEPFVTGREGGTGLGLALVYRHILQVGGSIDHAPREGGGTVFTVRWPPRVTPTAPASLQGSPLVPAVG
jgi:signal transduction histidine kinase